MNEIKNSRDHHRVQGSNLVDMDMIMNNLEDSQEEDAEVEAFIKKQIKDGSGRDYETIIKKDLVSYSKSKGRDGSSLDFEAITKYEKSKPYLKVGHLLENEEGSLFQKLDIEIAQLDKSE